MQLKKVLKTFSIAAMLFAAATPVCGQDLLARQAPVDRKMKALDTIALRHIIEREMAGNPSAQLYSEWSNKYAHQATALPDSFTIDLRHFAMPTDSRVITSNYGRRWGRMHKGIDVKVYIGDTIRSAFDGKVRVVRYEAGGYGNFVVIRHNNGLETIYGHMSKQLVRENQQVRAGDPIGLGGNTGRSTGSHLHFETRLCGVALDPALMFDFRAQDVTADFYTYRNKNKNRRAFVNDIASTSSEEFEPAEVEDVAPVKTTSTPVAKQSTKKNNRDNARFHKVAKGETLYSIAKRRGTTVDKLRKINHLGKKASIRPGQILRFS